MSPPFESSLSCIAKQEYIPEERKLLLQMAHDAISSLLEGRELSIFTASAHLSEPRGTFTTLYLHGNLRGCVGYPAPLFPLYRAVIETARAAAIDDPRFPPVTIEEAPKLRISLSVLSMLQPISAEQIVVGQHGLVISQGSQRGLLLPQVPVEHGWDRITFLEQTCLKAGLPPTAWRIGAGTKIEAFTAEVFGDPESEV
jgi:AmmeMemoRadiSam system protein A